MFTESVRIGCSFLACCGGQAINRVTRWLQQQTSQEVSRTSQPHFTNPRLVSYKMTIQIKSVCTMNYLAYDGLHLAVFKIRLLFFYKLTRI